MKQETNRYVAHEELIDILDYDPLTGIFTWKNPTALRCKVGDVAGTDFQNSNGKQYKRVMINGVGYQLHRLAWLYTYEEYPEHEIDHINGDGTDNRIENLRSVTRKENNMNKRKQSNNSSGVTGVVKFKRTGKWHAQIQVDGKNNHLGFFDNFNDAVIARKMAEQEFGFHANHGSENNG